MSFSVTPQSPPWSFASTSSPAGGASGSGPAVVISPPGLTPRTQRTGANTSPVRRPLSRNTTGPQVGATHPTLSAADWSAPVSPQDMGPENARAALLALDIAPQFLDAMKYDLRDCLNPSLDGPQEARMQRFVATYRHLVDMPAGLDDATVAALSRMLGLAEARGTAVPQTVPVLEMEPENARAALLAMGVTPTVLGRMAHDFDKYTDPFSEGGLEDLESRFLADYGTLVALPEGLDTRALARLADVLAGVPRQEPPAARPPQHLTPQDLTAQAQRITLDDGMSSADALQALRSLDVPEHGLLEMARDLVRIWQAPSSGNDQDPARVFAQKYGHLIALPQRLDADTTMALARVLAPYVEAVA